MTIEKTVAIPKNRRISFTLPPQVPVGMAKITLDITGVNAAANSSKREKPPKPLTDAEMEAGIECPVCKYYGDKPNAKTIAAFEETEAMLRGEIPLKEFSSFDEFLADLEQD